MPIDMIKIKKLIRLLEQSDVSEIEISEDGASVRISRHNPSLEGSHFPPPVHYYVPSGSEHLPGSPAPAPHFGHPHAGPSPQTVADETHRAEADTGYPINSPMVGTFYRASSPDAQPFVSVGQTVRKGQTLCIVEAMKMYNPIESEIEGVVEAIWVENGQPVEFGQTLLVIKPSG